MLPLTQQWASAFMERHEGVIVRVAGGGTAVGIEALVSGSIDVCAASRPLSAAEVERLFRSRGAIGVTHRVAKDALSVYVNRQNPVRNLSLLQLKGIFTGRIGWWAKVGGLDRPIRVVTRQPSSGTFLFFQELVLDGEAYAENATALPTTAAVAEAVEADPDAVGYGGIAYAPHLVHCRIEGISPTAANVRSGCYPLSRYLFLVTARAPEGWARRFIDWVLEPDGQRIVAEVGYLPVLPPVDSPGAPIPDEPGTPSQ